MKKTAILLGATLMVFAVTLGALGAHALKPMLLLNQRLDTFELALRYHFYHALALLILGLSPSGFFEGVKRTFSATIGFIALGVFAFSGSLYVLSLSGSLEWAFITPVGGVLLILGWISLMVAVVRK